MSALTEHIGNRIRLYRKNKHMSMDELSARISKSKPTVSKYENGAISIDADTLFDIARALGVSVHQLTDYHSPADARIPGAPRGIFRNPALHIYYYDGRVRRLVRGFLQIYSDGAGRNDATLYLDIDSFPDYANCRMLYHGVISTHDVVTNIAMRNQANEAELCNITALNPFGQSEVIWAMLTGISDNPLMPMAFRIAVSVQALPEDQKLLDSLVLSKEDLKIIKRYNAFSSRRMA